MIPVKKGAADTMTPTLEAEVQVRAMFPQIVEADTGEAGGCEGQFLAEGCFSQRAGKNQQKSCKPHDKAEEENFHRLKIGEKYFCGDKCGPPDEDGQQCGEMACGSGFCVMSLYPYRNFLSYFRNCTETDLMSLKAAVSVFCLYSLCGVVLYILQISVSDDPVCAKGRRVSALFVLSVNMPR